MAISGLLSLKCRVVLMSPLFCPIRRAWVAAQPEEIVRHKLVSLMVEELGYPLSLLVVEKQLRQIPHLALSKRKFPNRRADLICMGKGIHSKHALYPLLLVECKAVPLTDKVLRQVTGYNHHLQSYFVAVANDKEVCVGWYDKQQKEYIFKNGLPHYSDLLKGVQSI